MRVRILKLTVLYVLWGTAVATAAQRDAVVRVRAIAPDGAIYSGSGVCVDPSGIVFSVSHLAEKGRSSVYFGETAYPVVDALIPNQEGVAVLKLRSSRPFPYLRIAERLPTVGETVWVMGYPSGRWISYQTTVTTHSLRFADDPATILTGVSRAVPFGTSGGPLVTKDWTVAGIASVSGKLPPENWGDTHDRDSVRVSGPALEQTGGMYLALEHVQAAYEAYLSRTNHTAHKNINQKPVLYAFTTSNCDACRQFKQDHRDGRYSRFEVRVVEFGTSDWQAALTELRRYSSEKVPDTVPFFWIAGSERIVQQRAYHAPGLLQILAAIVQGLGRLIFNPDVEPSRLPLDPIPEFNSSRPESNDRSTAADGGSSRDASALDWSSVTVVVLIARQEVGRVRGLLREQALSVAGSPLKRRLAEATEHRATLEIVSQRLELGRFQAVVEAAGVIPEPVAIVLLVSRRELGTVKGIFVRRIEGALTGKYKQAPVELIFERLFPEDFAAVQSALLVTKPEQNEGELQEAPGGEQKPNDGDPWSPRHTIPGLAAAWLAERITTKLKRRFQKRREA